MANEEKVVSERNMKKSLGKFPIEVKSVFPKRRQEVLNLNGWGFSDSYFYYENGLKFKGTRYKMCNTHFNSARSKFLHLLHKDIKDLKPYSNPVHKESDYPPTIQNPEFMEELNEDKIEYSTHFDDRFFRCRGQSIRDFYVLRYKKFTRIPDVVIWPKSHEEVVKIVKLANKYLAVIIPFGGGTNITHCLNYEKNNERLFISLDMSQMNRILWIDRKSMIACIEAGIVGKDLEDALSVEGLTMGHEPDSLEFSTLGGWVATRSSGMKQQTYGNIEQIVEKVSLVTSVGVMEKKYFAPRASLGPDLDHIIIGSEGTLGVITKVFVHVHKIPPVRRYGSILFPDFESGTKFMYEVSQFKQKPSNLRLIDGIHIQLGQALKHNKSIFGDIVDSIRQDGVQWLFGYDFTKAALATYLIEGEREDADKIEKKLRAVGWKFLGLRGGARYGERAYLMTYTVCYIRDMFFDMGFLFESIEPSISWSKCWTMIDSIRSVWAEEMRKRNFFNVLAVRISQIYNDGVCVYFYYGIGPSEDKDQLETFEELTDILREVIFASGGSISHHHGVGKKSSKYYPSAVSKVGVDVFHAIKQKIDPKNVFDAGNIVDEKCSAKL